MCIRDRMEGNEADPGEGEDSCLCTHPYGAVSSTHLDVYKRQPLECCVRCVETAARLTEEYLAKIEEEKR